MTGPRILVSYSDSEALAVEQFLSRLRALGVMVLKDVRPKPMNGSQEPGSQEPGSDFHVILVSSRWFAGQLLPEIEDRSPDKLQILALDDAALTRCRQLRFAPWQTAKRTAFNDPAFWAWFVERFRIKTNVEFLAPKADDPGEIVSALELFVGRRARAAVPLHGGAVVTAADTLSKASVRAEGDVARNALSRQDASSNSDVEDVESALELFVGAGAGAAAPPRAGIAQAPKPPRRSRAFTAPAAAFGELRCAELRIRRFHTLTSHAPPAVAAQPWQFVDEIGPVACVVLTSALLATISISTPVLGPLAFAAVVGLFVLINRNVRNYLGRAAARLASKIFGAPRRLALARSGPLFLMGYQDDPSDGELAPQYRRRLRQLEDWAQLLETHHRSSALLIDNLKWEADRLGFARDRLALAQDEYAGAVSAAEEIFRNVLAHPEFRYKRVREVVTVDADCSASIDRDYEIEAGAQPVRMFSISIAPDESAQTIHFLSEIDFKVRLVAEATDESVRYLLFDNASLKKQIALFFLPVVEPGDRRSFRISYRWPRFSGDLAAFGRTTFYTAYRTGSEDDRANVQYELRVARSLGPLECAKLEDSSSGAPLAEEHTDLYWVWRYDNPDMPTRDARLAFQVRTAGAAGDDMGRIRTPRERNGENERT